MVANDMALARIISRSQQCSRELALDLLGRGYTVEIVSPDAIPDSLADLELRVESGPADVLTASVEAHRGARSTSLEFVHHLKAPMVDFIRRPPEATEAISFPLASVNLRGGQSASDSPAENIAEQTDLRAGDSRRAPALTRSISESLPFAHETVPLIVASEKLQTASKESQQPKEAAEPPRPAVAVTIHKSEPKSKTKRHRNHPEAWYWRSAVTFAAVVLVALLLGFGVHHDASHPAVPNSNAFGAEGQSRPGGETAILAGTSATADLTFGLAAPERWAVPAAAPSAGKSEGISARALNKSALSTGKGPTPKRQHQTARSDADDLVAPNTIVYFDQSQPKPVLAKKATHHGKRPLKQGDGVIAASTVLDLSAKPDSKAGRQK